MLKELFDRLGYALIGAVLGAVVAVGLWYLYDAGFTRRSTSPEIHLGLVTWIKYGSGVFAAIGFLFKADVGSAIGGTVREVHEHETRRFPAWLTILIVALVVGGWYFKSRHGSNT